MQASKTTDKDVVTALKLLWYIMTAFIVVVVLLRLTGAYDLNAHIYEIELNKWQSYAACWALYLLDVFIFLKIPTNESNKKIFIISFIWFLSGSILSYFVPFISYLEFIFLLVTPFIITRKWKVLVGTILLLIFYSIVQRLFVYGLLGSLTEYNKNDALLIVCLMLYYQVWVVVSYLNIKIFKEAKINE